LTREEIEKNIASIKQNFSSYIRYGDGPLDARMVNNADWILGLNYMNFLRDYGTCFTINRMLSFDSVKLRLDREQPLTFLEFNYMIMQGVRFSPSLRILWRDFTNGWVGPMGKHD
jgi:tyrosyl-tRNA synthetase